MLSCTLFRLCCVQCWQTRRTSLWIKSRRSWVRKRRAALTLHSSAPPRMKISSRRWPKWVLHVHTRSVSGTLASRRWARCPPAVWTGHGWSNVCINSAWTCATTTFRCTWTWRVVWENSPHTGPTRSFSCPFLIRRPPHRLPGACRATERPPRAASASTLTSRPQRRSTALVGWEQPSPAERRQEGRGA